MLTQTLRRLRMLDALQRLLLGLGVSGIVFLLLPTRVHLATRVIAAWDAFALVTLFLTWLIITGLQHHQVKRVCEQQDLSRRVISVVVVLAASVSLLAVGLLLGPVKGVRPEYANFHLILSIIAIAGSWLLLHTIFGMHYAHRYFLINRHRGQGTALHGLAFPGDAAPDYLDFEYFAFVIGMTFQVSDVEITARSLRRLVLMHSILSFAFNTLILALTVNVISSLV